MRKFLAMMLALAMVLSLAACGSKTDASTDTAADAAATKDSAAEPPMPLTPPTKLNVGVVGEPNTLDCEQGGENGMGSYETLFRTDSEGNVIYKLATGYEWVDDTTLVINVREGVTFHNGNAFDASDVLFSLKTCADNPQMFNRVANLDLENSEITDDYTVTLKTYEYSAVQIDYLCTVMMIDEDWYTENGGSIDQIVNGTGPYILQEWKMGDSLTLVRNENYWGDLPYFETIVVHYYTDASTCFMDYETGNLDVAEVFNAEDVQVMNDDGAPGYLVSSLSHHVTVLNMSTIVGDTYKNENLRQAIAHAINVDEMIASICGDMNIPATSLIPSDDANHIDVPFTYDVDAAAEYLEAYKAETGVQNVELNMVLDNEGYNPDIAEAIQFYLAEIGITMNVETIQKFDLIPRMIAGEIDLTLNSIGGGVDSNNMFSALERGSGNSSAEFTDETLCNLIAAAQVEKDAATRSDLYKQIQELNTEGAWSIPLYEPVLFYACQDYIGGVHVDAVSGQEMSMIDIYYAG